MFILSLQAIFKYYLLKNIEWNWSLFVQNFILMAYEFKDRLPLYEVYFLETMGDYQNKSTSTEATTYNHFQVIWTLEIFISMVFYMHF